MKFKYHTIPLSERVEYGERIIEPYREHLSDELLDEIRKIYTDYSFELVLNEALTDEELEDFEAEQKFEIYDEICYLLEKNGFLFYDDEDYEDI